MFANIGCYWPYVWHLLGLHLHLGLGWPLGLGYGGMS